MLKISLDHINWFLRHEVSVLDKDTSRSNSVMAIIKGTWNDFNTLFHHQ